MDIFSTTLLQIIHDKGLLSPGLDEQAVINQVLPTAEEWVVMQLVTKHLSPDDQALFRDAYASAPDVFDPAEFLSDTIPDFDALVDLYFSEWIDTFAKHL